MINNKTALIEEPKNQSIVQDNEKTRKKKQIKVKNSKSDKQTKSTRRQDTLAKFIFTICLLVTLLIISVFFNLTGGFDLYANPKFESVLGQNKRLVMNGYIPVCVSFIVEGNLVFGDEVYQQLSLKLPDVDLTGYELRFQIYVGDNKGEVKVLGYDENWEYNETDKYYFYKNDLTRLATIGVSDRIKIDSEIQLNSKIYYNLVVNCWLQSI